MHLSLSLFIRTANHSSLRVVRVFLTARFSRCHSCHLPTRRHLPPAATAAAQALKICANLCHLCTTPPWVSLLYGQSSYTDGTDSHRFDPPPITLFDEAGATRRVVRVRVRQITWVAAMPRCDYPRSSAAHKPGGRRHRGGFLPLPTFLMHTLLDPCPCDVSDRTMSNEIPASCDTADLGRRAKIISPPARLSGWFPRWCATVAHQRGNHGDRPQWRGDYFPPACLSERATRP